MTLQGDAAGKAGRAGRNVVVTGGASGIGLSVAERLVKRGDSVAIWDRQGDEATRVAAFLEDKYGSAAIGVAMDQKNPESVERALEITNAAIGPSQVLFANAGVATMGSFLELPIKDWSRAIDVNLTGSFFVCQSIARSMVANQISGSIVVNVSISASFNSVGLSHYCASKAGLGMLVQCMASELGMHDIRVNGVAPGIIETKMTEALLADPEVDHMTRATTPLGRSGTADEVARVVEFLASDDSNYVTGQTLLVCGGQSVPSIPAYKKMDYSHGRSSSNRLAGEEP